VKIHFGEKREKVKAQHKAELEEARRSAAAAAEGVWALLGWAPTPAAFASSCTCCTCSKQQAACLVGADWMHAEILQDGG
jgi:hypothetical protein